MVKSNETYRRKYSNDNEADQYREDLQIDFSDWLNGLKEQVVVDQSQQTTVDFVETGDGSYEEFLEKNFKEEEIWYLDQEYPIDNYRNVDLSSISQKLFDLDNMLNEFLASLKNTDATVEKHTNLFKKILKKKQDINFTVSKINRQIDYLPDEVKIFYVEKLQNLVAKFQKRSNEALISIEFILDDEESTDSLRDDIDSSASAPLTWDEFVKSIYTTDKWFEQKLFEEHKADYYQYMIDLYSNQSKLDYLHSLTIKYENDTEKTNIVRKCLNDRMPKLESFVDYNNANDSELPKILYNKWHNQIKKFKEIYEKKQKKNKK